MSQQYIGLGRSWILAEFVPWAGLFLYYCAMLLMSLCRFCEQFLQSFCQALLVRGPGQRSGIQWSSHPLVEETNRFSGWTPHCWSPLRKLPWRYLPSFAPLFWDDFFVHFLHTVEFWTSYWRSLKIYFTCSSRSKIFWKFLTEGWHYFLPFL